MTALLVSVRNVVEAEAALAGGAAVIDVKEPARGALGAADPATWRAVIRAVAGRAPVSAALGELFGAEGGPAAAAALASQTEGLTLAKLGLAGAALYPDWPQRWREALSRLPPSVAPVAVAYADWRAAQAPRPMDVIVTGAELGCQTLLIDTYGKAGGHLLTHLPLPALTDVARRAAQRGMHIVLAGSLTVELLPEVLPLCPALIAVRGAACRPDRRGAIDAALVRKLTRALCQEPAEERAAAAIGPGA